MAERLRADIIQFQEQRAHATDGALALDLRASTLPMQTRDSNVVFLEQRQRSPLREKIDYFDQNYRQEGLPRDWWNINDVGFSMKRQMGLLQNADPMSISTWAEQTERDFLGFTLEYLLKRKVFPFEYRIVGGRFIDKKYGGKEMLEMIDPRERGGAVLEAATQGKEELKKGKRVAIVSPEGKSGITMDDGTEIVFHNTMVFYMEKHGDRIVGTGFGLDFNLNEARLLVEKLTGRKLPKTSSAIDCIKALATFDEFSEVKNPYDLVNTFATVKNDSVFSDMVLDLGRRDTLYNFDAETRRFIQEFKDYVVSSNLSNLEFLKALAATFLRLSKYMLDNQRRETSSSFKVGRGEIIFLQTTYGQIVEEVRKIPGCAGGGNSVTSTSSIIERSAFALMPDKYGERTFECPSCHKTNIRPENQLISNCQHCGGDVKC